MHVVETMVSTSVSDRPKEKKHDLSMLMARPERALKSSKTCKIDWTESKEPSEKIKISSAKHKWVSLDS